MALGNFDQNLSTTPLLQAAFIVAYDCANNNQGAAVVLWPMEQSGPVVDFAASQSSALVLTESIILATIAAGDTQGRSLILGEPDIVRVTGHSQPRIILGAPPMHVDWAPPVGSNEAQVLNLSTVPDSFFSQYETKTQGMTQSSQKSTTSYAVSTKETAGGSVTFGAPDIDDVKVSYTESSNKHTQHLTARALIPTRTPSSTPRPLRALAISSGTRKSASMSITIRCWDNSPV